MKAIWITLIVFTLLCSSTHARCAFGCKCPNDIEAVCACGTSGVVKDIPQTLSPTLQRLTIDGCPLRALSNDDLGRYSKLTHLTISNTKLRVIRPYAFRGINRLRMLAVQNNADLRSIDSRALSGIHGNGQLSIYLDGNNISVVNAKAFDDTFGLRKLDLTNNPLKVIKTGAFTGLYNCNVIRLPRGISSIESGAFSNVTRVHTLMVEAWSAGEGVLPYTFANLSHVDTVSIARSHLGVIHSNAFASIRTIRSLRITESTIARLSALSFTAMSHVGELMIADNTIDTIEADVFGAVPTKETRLLVERNMINCSCKNAWLWEMDEIRLPVRMLDNNYCSWPNDLEERTLARVPLAHREACGKWSSDRLVGAASQAIPRVFLLAIGIFVIM